jgi:LPXTG-motif cell wall-anchored protein
MISTRIPRRLLGTSALLAAGLVGVVGLAPALASAATVGGPGSLIVEKTVTGKTNGTFGFHVTCGDSIDRNFTLDANTSTEFDSIPNGTTCLVTETDDGGADSTTVTPADGTVVIPRDDTIKVTFVNVFEAPTTTTTKAPTTTTTMAATTTTTMAPTTTTTSPTVLGVTITAPPAPPVAPAELPRTGSSTAPALVTVGLALTALGIALRRKATRITTLR